MSFTVPQLISNIKSYACPHVYPLRVVWPPARRSAVCIVLFVGKYGELRVLLTKRSRQLNNFSGHVSLPGGKSDNDQETDWEVARRESKEEIGLPYDEELTKQGLTVEKLNTMPFYLSRTFLSVRPVVCFLHRQDDRFGVIKDIKFLLNPGETASIFSIPLLDLIDQNAKKEYLKKTISHYKWGRLRWPIKHFFYPTKNVNEVPWLDDVLDLSSDEEFDFADGLNVENTRTEIKDLWGLTAQILFDLANIAVGNPSRNYIGNENLIYGLTEFGGQMGERARSDWESAMIANKRGVYYDDVLPQHIFKSIVDEFKL